MGERWIFCKLYLATDALSQGMILSSRVRVPSPSSFNELTTGWLSCVARGARGPAVSPAADVRLEKPGTAPPRPRGRCPPGLRCDPPLRAPRRASAPGTPAAAAVGSFS